MIREQEVLVLEWAEKNGSQRQRGKHVNTLEITYSGRFKEEYRFMKKRGYDMRLLKEVIRMLETGEPLERKYKDHPLDGDL